MRENKRWVINNLILHETAAEDRIPLLQKIIYGLGAFVNNLLADAIGRMVIVLNLGLGMNPALVGLISALPRLTDAITDPLMGYISDHTRSKWGRRRPYIFAGAIAAGVIYALIWQLPEGQSESFYFWLFLLGSFLFYLAYTVFATPWVALGYELTADYNERTRLMGVQNFMGQFAYLVSPWFLWIMQNEAFFDNMIVGAGQLAIVIGVFTICIGTLPALFLTERAPKFNANVAKGSKMREQQAVPVASVRDFFKGFAIALKFKPFLKLCLATFLVFNGFMLVASFQSYVIIYYVFAGDTSLGSEYAGWSGTVSTIATLCIIFFITWLATKIGKRRAFFWSTGVSMFGYALKWFCYSPEHPWLLLVPAPFVAFGLGGLFTLMGSMIADVCDLDELETHQRREGMFGSIYWWVVKLGMAAALAAGGFLLNATGFDVALGGAQSESTLTMMRLCDAVLPIIAYAIAIWAIASYSLSEEKTLDIRAQLEQRRGVLR